MQAEQDSEYDDSEVEELKLKLIKYVIEKLNPMIAQLNLIKEDKKKLKEFVSDNESVKNVGTLEYQLKLIFIQLVSAVIVELKIK